MEELREYLEQNRQFLVGSLKERIPAIHVVEAEATYLAWIDCSEITEDTKELCAFIREKTGLYLSAGDIFGGNGSRFVRWNYACPKTLLEDGIQRFVEGVKLYKKNIQYKGKSCRIALWMRFCSFFLIDVPACRIGVLVSSWKCERLHWRNNQ